MPRVQPVPVDEAPQAARPVFERFVAERGVVPNMFRTLALRPEMMNAFAESLRAVFQTGALPVRLKEMVTVRVSQVNGCSY